MSFSKQDSRYEPPPVSFDNYGAAEMMADLGIHRRVALPLAGSRQVLPPPPPDITKHDPKIAKLAQDYPDIPNSWAALFDPKLVEERDDGLGDGQMHRRGPNYQPINDTDDRHGRRGSHRMGRYSEMGSPPPGRNPRHERSPPNRALRHAKSLFELGKIPDIPFFNKGPLDSSRTVNGVAVQRRRAALRAASISSGHSLEGPSGDPLAPLRQETEPVSKKRAHSRGAQDIVKHHLAGNARISLRAPPHPSSRVGSAPPHTLPLQIPPKPSAMQTFALPGVFPQRQASMPPHLSLRNVVRNPEVSKWNTGKLATDSKEYDYLAKPAAGLSQIPAQAKVDQAPSSGNLFKLPIKENDGRVPSSGGLFQLPTPEKEADQVPSTKTLFQPPNQQKVDSTTPPGSPTIPSALRKRPDMPEPVPPSIFPPVSPVPIIFPFVPKASGDSSPVIFPSAQTPPGTAKPVVFKQVFSSNTGSIHRPQAIVEPGAPFIFKLPVPATPPTPGPNPVGPFVFDLKKSTGDTSAAMTPHKGLSANSQPEAARTPPLGPLEPVGATTSKDSTTRVEKDSLEVHTDTNSPGSDKSSEEDDATLESLHNDISAIKESVNKLKTEVSGIDDFEKSLQARISRMMKLKGEILKEIEDKEESMARIENELQEIKRKRETLKQAMPVVIQNSEVLESKAEPTVMAKESPDVGDYDTEMPDLAEEITQVVAEPKEYQAGRSWETKSPTEQLTSKSSEVSQNKPVKEEGAGVKKQLEVTSETKPSIEAQTEESPVNNYGKDERHSDQETKETKPSKINEQLTRNNLQTLKAQKSVESEVAPASDESIRSDELQASLRKDGSVPEIPERPQWMEARSQGHKSDSTHDSDSTGSFETHQGKVVATRKQSDDDLRASEKAEQDRLTALCEQAEQERLAEIKLYEKAEKERLEIKRLVKEHLERVESKERHRAEAKLRRGIGQPPSSDDESSDDRERRSVKSNRVTADAHGPVLGNVEQNRQEASERVTEHEKVKMPLRKAMDTRGATGLRRTSSLGDTVELREPAALSRATSPKGSVAETAGSEYGPSKPKRPRFPYHISLDLRPNYDVYPLRVEVGLHDNPEEAITKKCKELMTPAGYLKLISMSKLRSFLDQCNKRHEVRLARYHASG